MITDNEKFQKEVKDMVDNKIVSWSLLRWLNNKEAQARADFINLMFICLFGKENKLLWALLYLIFRKEIKELLDDSKQISKETLLKFVEKLKNYKKQKNI